MSDSGNWGTSGGSGGSGGSAPAGWYPDGQGGQRWWDGSQWGPVGQPPAGPPAGPPGEAPAPTMAMPTSPPPAYAPGGGYPGYPPPGGPPGGPGAGGGSRRNPRLLLGILGGLVGVAVVVIVLVLTLGGGSGPSSDDPVETVSAFFDAAKDGDCEAAAELLTDDAKSLFQIEDCAATDPTGEFADVEIEVGDARVDGDSAVVPVTTSGAQEAFGIDEVTLGLELLRTDGVWLIDGFDLGSLLEDLPDLGDLPDAPELSDVPTDLPSDLPGLDDLENFDPEDFLSDFPSDFLSDFPSDLLSDFPSDFDPEEFLSDFPTDFLSDFPTQ